MLRLPCLVAVAIAVVGFACVSAPANASADIPPLSLQPAKTTPISTRRHSQLTLDHDPPAHVTDRFLVGRSAAEYSSHADVTIRVPGYLREEADFVRTRISSPGFFDKLASLFDVDEVERPWDTTTTVHFLAAEPVIGKFTPFATFSHQVDVNEIAERLGIGGGLLYKLSKNMTLSSDVEYFGADREIGNSGFNKETVFMTRLEIDF